jgi:hypothetical protein
MGPLDTRLPHLEKVNDRRKVRKRLAGASGRLDQPAIVQHEPTDVCSERSSALTKEMDKMRLC